MAAQQQKINVNKSNKRPFIPRNRNEEIIEDNKDRMLVPPLTTVPEVKQEDFDTWFNSLYSVDEVSAEEVKAMYDAFAYKGFNRTDVLKQLYTSVPDRKVATEIIVAVALRGPKAASYLKLSSGRTCIEMGIPASGGQGTKILTLNKIQSSTADLAAFYLKKMNAPKRLNMDLPGWLQFPAAGSIKLPDNLRIQHIEFSKRFSEVIGGVFQDQIYAQMEINSYLDPRLKLF